MIDDSDEAIAKAVLLQKTGGVSSNALVMLARALSLPESTVMHVVCAYNRIARRFDTDNRVLVTDELRRLLEDVALLTSTQSLFASCIEHQNTVDVPVKVLTKKQSDICRGCPKQLDCIAESISTADRCYNGRLRYVAVRPLKMTDTEVVVEAKQPAGIYRVKLKDLVSAQ